MAINRTINHFLAAPAAQAGGKYSRLCSTGSPCGPAEQSIATALREGSLAPLARSYLPVAYKRKWDGGRVTPARPPRLRTYSACDASAAARQRAPPGRATDYSLSFVAIGRLSASIHLCPARPRCQAQMINQRQVSGGKKKKPRKQHLGAACLHTLPTILHRAST